jgi:hypothetical protein
MRQACDRLTQNVTNKDSVSLKASGKEIFEMTKAMKYGINERMKE